MNKHPHMYAYMHTLLHILTYIHYILHIYIDIHTYLCEHPIMWESQQSLCIIFMYMPIGYANNAWAWFLFDCIVNHAGICFVPKCLNNECTTGMLIMPLMFHWTKDAAGNRNQRNPQLFYYFRENGSAVIMILSFLLSFYDTEGRMYHIMLILLKLSIFLKREICLDFVSRENLGLLGKLHMKTESTG